MKQIFAVALLYLCNAVFAQQANWTNLFNGKNLDGWEQKGGRAKFSVENGDIIGVTVANTPNSFLCTKQSYGDFILELQLKVEDNMTDYLTCNLVFDKNKQMGWLGQLHLLSNLKNKFGDMVCHQQTYRTPGTPNLGILKK